MAIPRYQVVQQIIESGIIAIIRIDEVEKIEKVVDALVLGGVHCLEVPMTVPGALNVIREITSRQNRDFLFGAGSVLDAATARQVIEAGADFIVAPNLDIETIQMAHRYDKTMIAGAFTPTEVITAWAHGSDLVKVFPAALGGPKYIQEIHAPMPQVLLVPTGGASVENIGKFYQAGAACVGVGSALIDKTAIKVEDYTTLTQKAHLLVEAVQAAREK